MLPLNGYRILVCEDGLAGPLCSRQLADLGAEIVKIERPERTREVLAEAGLSAAEIDELL